MTDTTPPANLTPAEVAEWEAACEVIADIRKYASSFMETCCDPTTVRARLREISDLRGQVASLKVGRGRLRALGNAVESAEHEIVKNVGRKGVAERFIRSRDALDELLAALRTEAGTARLDTEGESDGE